MQSTKTTHTHTKKKKSPPPPEIQSWVYLRVVFLQMGNLEFLALVCVLKLHLLLLLPVCAHDGVDALRLVPDNHVQPLLEVPLFHHQLLQSTAVVEERGSVKQCVKE